ncbi:hypothetical protein N0V82_000151 [Gnomoniopsis sp. IMI 355080]|nr:hypothetical protein N0V82_000151 [Gnomoniopsis sp. IMI 355080]
MTKRALLIGVDDYLELGKMTGCRNDVRLISRLLQAEHGFERQHVLEMLVNPLEVVDLGAPVDEKKTPTYDNIMKVLKRLLQSSHAGDLVYVHFSGMVAHGPTILPEYSTFLYHYRDIVLLPMDVGAHPERVLRDLELSVIFHRLVEMGVEVTAVLDCRRFPAGHEHPPTATPSIPLEELRQMVITDGKRCHYGEPRKPESWVFDPEPGANFTMLTSFDFDMKITQGVVKLTQEHGWMMVNEIEDERGEWHGFLTFWINKVLRNQDGNLRFREVYRLILQESVRGGIKGANNKISITGNQTRPFPGGLFSQRTPAPESSDTWLSRHHEQQRQPFPTNTSTSEFAAPPINVDTDILRMDWAHENESTGPEKQDKTESITRTWFCQNMSYIVHRTQDSLAKALQSETSVEPDS